jgi:putative peptidoglycan lipid II flippase
LVNAGLLWWALRRKGFYTPIVGWFKLLLQSALAVCVMAVSLWWLQSTILPDWAAACGLERAGALLFLVVVGIFSYASALLVFGMRKRHWVF